MKRRSLLKGTALGLIAATLAGGDFLISPAEAFERTDAGNVIVFGGRQAIPVLDPHIRYDWSTRMIQQAVYDALVKYEGDPAEVKPWLAESWDVSEDGKTWTFHLVKDAKFHNGDPVTAEAVQYSFVRGLELNKGVAWMLKDFLKPEGVRVVDDYTIAFDLDKPYSPFLSFLPWWYVVNPAQVKEHEVDGDYGQKWLTDNEAGSGPFTLGRWEPNVLYEVNSVEDYWKGWPQGENRPAGVIYRIIREPAAQKAALQRGEADIVEGLTSDDYVQIANAQGIVVEDHKGMTTFGIKFNNQKGPTADINLRKAIAYALDYDALVQIYNGAATLETSPLPGAMKGHIDVPGIPRQDLAKAKEYLAKSAYPDGGITLDYVHVAGLEEARRIGLVLLDNLKALNIDVNIKPEQWPNMVAAGASIDTTPDMTSIYATPISTDPDSVAYMYHKDSWDKYYGIAHYENPEVWAMIDEARAETDWDKRAALYAKIQTQIVADQPEVFGMLQNRRWARRDYLQGFTFSPVRFTGEVDLYPLWIKTE
ncbi:ABC transporter substrate-binding protein [Martelella alba]|uniref:ABC transporter substrate-binding protein n=1 Tax=Martelella alba TaxID=2590451 RepID=A0A506U276_9HYPH|nr:ABC transporter substrate-binding protein [Martelella alba]TPW27890.1 ABC transporter substrate-binding protein [Martelella alba]